MRSDRRATGRGPAAVGALSFAGRRAMKRFYQAADLQQAHILAGLLREAGVDARVFHGNAQGAFGELPHVPPEIWLGNEKDAVQAREIVQAFERTPSAQGAVFCRGCGEESPANFELCWKCGTGL